MRYQEALALSANENRADVRKFVPFEQRANLRRRAFDISSYHSLGASFSRMDGAGENVMDSESRRPSSIGGSHAVGNNEPGSGAAPIQLP